MDLAAVIEYLPWDAPLKQAVHPKEWVWGNPLMDPLVGAVDLLSNIATKTPRPRGLAASKLPKPTERPWAKSEKRASADVVSLAELDALYTTA
jgi:hypothetical protein